jgi:hypothetical protein
MVRDRRLPSDEWHHVEGLHWHGRIDPCPHTRGAPSHDAAQPSTLATPYAVSTWLSQQIRQAPARCQVQSNTGDGWIPAGDGRAAELAYTHVLAAAQLRSVSIRIYAAPGAYCVVAEAVTPDRCQFNCLTVHRTPR